MSAESRSETKLRNNQMEAHKQPTVKEIARLSGVSVGTVDRVIHNRGEVSAKSREKVLAVLDKLGYSPNLQVSSIGTKKKFCVTAVLPTATSGYWYQLKAGIRQAVYEFSHISLEIKFLHYDQFDLFSCKETYAQALKTECDAMIIGPTFNDETLQLSYALETRGIPYVFVDAMVANTNPIAFFGPDSLRMGYMLARLILGVMEKHSSVMLLRSKRIGDETSHNSHLRRNGFKAYIKEKGLKVNLVDCTCDVTDSDSCSRSISEALAANPNIGGIVVFNSRVYMVAEYLKKNDIRGINLIGCGLIDTNIAYLKEEYITYLLSEHPDLQGYSAVKSILEYLLYGKQSAPINYTPVDILIKENVDYV